jgi:hypothetical protein
MLNTYNLKEYLITEAKEKQVTESSLSRLWSHNELHDCGALTAFRKFAGCEQEVKITREENKKRNLALAADLKQLGYNITKLIGAYPEGGTVTKEVSYFVVDSKDKGTLKTDLQKLGEKYEQDSILFVPQGAITNKATATLIGTNHCKNNFLKYGTTLPFNNGKLGVTSPIYTSYINDRPFIFETCTISDDIFGSATNIRVAAQWAK